MSKLETYNTRVTLLQRLKDSDENSNWQEFIDIYQKYLYTVVRNQGQSHHDTEEIVQAVFSKVWSRLPTFEYLPHKGRFRHWLCAIAKNLSLDQVRRNNANERMKHNLQEAVLLDEHFSADSEIAEIADKEWKNYLANRALEEAKEMFNQTIVDVFTNHVKGKTISQTAEACDVAENTVYIYCRKVKDFIKQRMIQMENEWG